MISSELLSVVKPWDVTPFHGGVKHPATDALGSRILEVHTTMEISSSGFSTEIQDLISLVSKKMKSYTAEK